jgi:serine/threonine-protein kinase
MVLMFTDVEGSVALKNRIGTEAYAAALARHDAVFRRIVSETHGAQILSDTGDGFFAAFASATDAVRAALAFQRRVASEAQPLKVRCGLHAGEVTHIDESDGSGKKVVGLAADLAARLTSLAVGGQVLLTRFPFNEARQFIRAHPESGRAEPAPEVRWVAHGEYLFKGADEPVEVFEVGAAGSAPLSPPSDNSDARRALRPGDELTLGWRPAGGLEMRQRPHWVIREKLGEGGFGEVWLAEHAKTRTRRVFKFCFDAQRLRALKREVVLFRLLKDALGDRRDIARVTDYQFDEPPYFIEYEHIPGGSLPTWAEARGGIAKVPREIRVRLVARIAEALAAAHSVGVLHKDVKPSNVLIASRADSDAGDYLDVYPVLTDFGIGILTDRTQLGRRDITAFGFTQSAVTENDSSRTGTRLYAPPESLMDRPHTVQGDVYALGVLLYQMVVGDLSRPLAEGWERHVDDELLRGDIAACVEGDPARRLGSAAELASRLDHLEQRRVEQQLAARARASTKRRQQLIRALAAMLIIVVLVAAALAWSLFERSRRVAAEAARARAEENRRIEAESARDRVKREADKAIAVTEFLRHMISSADPAQANNKDVKVREMLDVAAQRIEEGKVGQAPEVETAVRAVIGRTYLTLGLYPAAEQHLARAVEMGRKWLPDDRMTLKAAADLSVANYYSGRYPEAEEQMNRVLSDRRRVLGADDPDTADALFNLSLLYGTTRRFEESEKFAREAMSIREKHFGAESLEVAASLQHMGLFAVEAADPTRAEQILKQSLAIRRKLLPPNHFEIGNSLNNLALVYFRRGDLDAALEHFTGALENFQTSLSEEHPNVAQALTNIASIHARRLDFAAALPFAQRAMKIQEKLLPEDHPDLAMSIGMLGVIHYSTQDYTTAALLVRRAGDIMEKRHGPDHPFSKSFKRTLAFIYRDDKRYDESLPLFREAIDAYRRSNEPAEAVQTEIGYVECMLWAGRYADAEPVALETHAHAKALENATQRRKLTADALTLLVQLYDGWGKPEKAAEYRTLLSAATRPATLPSSP